MAFGVNLHQANVLDLPFEEHGIERLSVHLSRVLEAILRVTMKPLCQRPAPYQEVVIRERRYALRPTEQRGTVTPFIDFPADGNGKVDLRDDRVFLLEFGGT